MMQVAILGAGLMGRLLAWRWAKSGAAVTVYERASEHKPDSAAHTAAAMVAPISERGIAADQVYHRGLRSLELWPQLVRELNQETGLRVAMGRSGTLLLAHGLDAALMNQWRQTLQHHDIGSDQVSWLDEPAIAQLEPALAGRFRQGCYVPTELHLDNRTLLTALQQAAAAYDAVFCFETPIHQANGHYWCADQRLKADLLIDCRGIGARDLTTGERPRAVRGEVCWIESTQVQLTRPVRLLHPRYSLYLVPKPSPMGRFRYILGATEIESDDNSPVSVRSALEMLSALYSINPALAEARILELDANLRPAYADHIARFEQSGNCVCINGLFRHGFLQAPALLQELQQQLNWPLQLPFADGGKPINPELMLEGRA